jgi:hypothetical protein
MAVRCAVEREASIPVVGANHLMIHQPAQQCGLGDQVRMQAGDVAGDGLRGGTALGPNHGECGIADPALGRCCGLLCSGVTRAQLGARGGRGGEGLLRVGDGGAGIAEIVLDVRWRGGEQARHVRVNGTHASIDHQSSSRHHPWVARVIVLPPAGQDLPMLLVPVRPKFLRRA